MNYMSQKESLAGGRKRIRRELAACLICISLLVFTGTLFSDSDDPYDDDYVGDNAFCGHDNTLIQQVYAVCSPAVANVLNSTAWINKLKDMTAWAQTVDIETYWMYEAPFISVTGSDPNFAFAPWSDTWGICGYFENHTFANTAGYDVIDSEQKLIAWRNALINLAPDNHCWMVGLITGFGGPYDGSDGVTADDCKTTIMVYNVASILFLHEYGHTGTHRTTNDEAYGWPYIDHVHYGDQNTPALCTPSYYDLNLMYWSSDDSGYDADDAYKVISFPFYYYYPYESYCWDAQW